MQKLKVKEKILVLLKRRGLEAEICQAEYLSEGINSLLGRLLEEPRQNFGDLYHKGGIIGFLPIPGTEETNIEDQQVFYMADLTPPDTFLREDFRDGRLVRSAIARYHSDGSIKNLDEILRLLRDSTIWVPYMKNRVSAGHGSSTEDDPLGILGTKYRGDEGETAKEPDLLQNPDGSAYYFPVFTDREEIGAYNTQAYECIHMPFLQAIKLAEDASHSVTGILVNAFTEPFLAASEVLAMTAALPSRIVDPSDSEQLPEQNSQFE